MTRDFLGVPEGFESDGASVPWLLRPFFRDLNEYPFVLYAIRHDFRYTHGTVARDVADSDYRRDLIAEGYSPVKASLVYLGVRHFGWRHWHGKE